MPALREVDAATQFDSAIIERVLTGARPPSLRDLRYPDLHNDPGLRRTLNGRNKVRVSPFLRRLRLRRPVSVLLN